MDDLTVRTGRVVDGKFYTRTRWRTRRYARCAPKAAPKWLLRARSLLWKLWASSPNPRSTTRRGRIPITRPEREPLGALNPEGFQGCGFKGFWGRVVRGLFAALLKGARGVSAAFVHNARRFPRRFCVTRGGLPRCSVRTRGGLTSERRPFCLRGFVRAFRRQCESRSAAFCVGVEGRRLGGVTLECLASPRSPPQLATVPQRTLQRSE